MFTGEIYVASTGKTVGTIVEVIESIGSQHIAAARANTLWRNTGIVHPCFTDRGTTVIVKPF